MRPPIALDPFCFRQFDNPEYSGTQVTGISKQDFINEVNRLYMESPDADTPLQDGYASFCKHLFVPNFTSATSGTVELVPELMPLVESGYEARRQEELPVLSRWIRRERLVQRGMDFVLKPAKYLDLILYSDAQIEKESAACPSTNEGKYTRLLPSASGGTCTKPTVGEESRDGGDTYSIIAIKAQNVPHELPMLPITALRNCLLTEGGSGVPLDREAYMKSVAYWNAHCELR